MAGSQSGSHPHHLKLQISTVEGATIVHCSGRLTAEVSAILKEKVKTLIPGTTRLVLDLTDLSYMDSGGLGTLVGLYVSAKTAGCELQLINLNKRVRELLGLTNLLSVFESCGKFFTKLP